MNECCCMQSDPTQRKCLPCLTASMGQPHQCLLDENTLTYPFADADLRHMTNTSIQMDSYSAKLAALVFVLLIVTVFALIWKWLVF